MKLGSQPITQRLAPSTVPALAVREPDAAITRRGRAGQKELGGLTSKASSPHTTVHQEGNQPRAWRRIIASQLSSSFKGFPNQMLLTYGDRYCSQYGPQLFPILPYSGIAWWTDCLAWMKKFLLPQFAQSFLGVKMQFNTFKLVLIQSWTQANYLAHY